MARGHAIALLSGVLVILCLVAPGAESAQGKPKTGKSRQQRVNHAADIVTKTAPQIWAETLRGVMANVKGVSWHVLFQDLGLGALDPALLADDPDLGGTEPQMMQVMQCLNSQFQPGSGRYMDWDLTMQDAVDKASLKVVGAWWSNHKPSGPITAVTSSSVNRLTQLYAQCKSWQGPLSAALYIPLVLDNGRELSQMNQATLLTAVLQVAQFMADMQALRNVCTPDVILFWEVLRDEPSAKLLYPLNLPRNIARLQARTPLIAEVDIDLVVSRSLSARFADPLVSERMIQEAQRKTVWIIPAFDISRGIERAAWADALVSFDKEMMIYAFSRNFSHQFDVRGYPQGHNITNFDKWMTATQDYSVKHGHMAEPWFVGARTVLPWHDDRYRGYGKDKVQYVEDTAAKGFGFKVLWDAFVIHRAHKKGEAANLYLKQLRNNGTGAFQENMYTHFNKIYREQVELQDAGQPWVAPVHRATLACQRALPWWQGAPSLAHLKPLPTLRRHRV